MQGYLSIILHAHLPFVRHPEHEKFLEESWLFEAVAETYVPLLQVMEGWRRDGMETRLTLTLTPTLCSMLLDPLLQDRCVRRLNELIELTEKEIHRTHWDKPFNELALMYHRRFTAIRDTYLGCGRNLVAAFGQFQEQGRLEIITSAATHALLPLLAPHPQSLRAQILVARDHYRSCFGCDPRGIWLPECAYVEGVESVLQEANIRWFITDTHGILHANPQPRYGVFAPLFTPNGIAAFGRDLDFDYVKPHLPAPDQRGFTGIKYYRITGEAPDKQVYDRRAALQAAADHAQHFLEARLGQIRHLAGILDRPPLVLSPYDAELFGHWWYEGPEFLDYFVRKAYFDQKTFVLLTPGEYLREHPTNQIARPAASSWGEEGYWRVWLNESNAWIYPHLRFAQERMTELARRYPDPKPLQQRALKQAARELLLAQASDWPFILRTGTSPEYARKRVKNHLLRFIALHEQLTSTRVDEPWLGRVEQQDNLFPEVDYRYWV